MRTTTFQITPGIYTQRSGPCNGCQKQGVKEGNMKKDAKIIAVSNEKVRQMEINISSMVKEMISQTKKLEIWLLL